MYKLMCQVNFFASSFFLLAGMQTRWLELQQLFWTMRRKPSAKNGGASGYKKLRSLAKWGWQNEDQPKQIVVRIKECNNTASGIKMLNVS